MRKTRRSLVLAVGSAYRADKLRFSAVLVLSTAASLVGVLSAYWLRRIVDSAGAGDESGALAGAIGMGLTVGLGVLANASVTRMQFPLKEKTGLYLDRRLISLVSGIATLDHHERPQYLDRLDVLRREMHVLGFAGTHTAEGAALVVQVSATAILLASVNPLLLVVPLFAIPSLWLGARAEQLRQTCLDATADRSRRTRQLFELATSPAAGKELRVFGVGEELVRRHRDDWREADKLLDGTARRGVWLTALGWTVFSAGYAGSVVLVVDQAVRGNASLGDVVLALALVAQINGQVSLAVETVSDLAQTLKVADRYLWLNDYAMARHAAVEHSTPAPNDLDEGIRLSGVTFRYPDSDVDVLSDFDLFLPAGATVAVVGENGAGKSTLVKLLCRFYEPSEGRITVDGIDLLRIDVAEWRARISAGFQDFARLELTACRTVGVGDLPLVDDAAAVEHAMWRAASVDVISALPEGLETQLGSSFDSGVELSGGQWQKLALARAMMRPNPLLLVLDEPTAGLDADTEHDLFVRYVTEAKALAAQNCAITILVSHRFSTVRMADLIVVIDGGRVVGMGSHDDLIGAGGLYGELYELHARGYRPHRRRARGDGSDD